MNDTDLTTLRELTRTMCIREDCMGAFSYRYQTLNRTLNASTFFIHPLQVQDAIQALGK